MSWEDVAFRVEVIEGPAITALLGSLRVVYSNGGVVLRSLQAEDPTEFLEGVRQASCGANTLNTLLTNPSVVRGTPELGIAVPLKHLPDFRWMSAFGMEGDLTHMLLNGGAYEKFRGTVDEARLMTQEFMESVFGKDLQTLWVSSSPTPWTDWFCDIAWDATFVVWDNIRHRFVLLCCTDSD